MAAVDDDDVALNIEAAAPELKIRILR